MKKLLVCTLLIASQSFAQDVTIHLNSYLWSRPTAKGHELDITQHGVKMEVKLFVSGKIGLQRDEVTYKGDNYTATIKAYRNNKEGIPAYVIFQSKVVDKNGELITECSNYSSIDFAPKMGVGACTGRVGDRQVGISFARP